MEKIAVIEYILNYKIVTIQEIIDKFEVHPDVLLAKIAHYNEISFTYEVICEDGLITVKEKTNNIIVDNKTTRLLELELLWQTSLFKISELEIIFGRSRKTLYKNIQQIKKAIGDTKNINNIIQIQLNKYEYNKLLKIATYKMISVDQVIRNICQFLSNEFKIKADIKQIVNLNLTTRVHGGYDQQSQVFASELIHTIETYLKVKFINKYKREQVYHHIKSSYYKYINNIYIKRIDIENTYPRDVERFEKVSTIIEMQFKSVNLFYNDEELLYLSLYFLDASDFSYLKVQVITKEGSSKLLVENQLLEHFDHFHFVECNPDYIISTYASEADTIVKVKFDVSDIKQIARHLKLKSNRVNDARLFLKLKPLLKNNISLNQFSECLTSNGYHTKRSLLECIEDRGFFKFRKIDNLSSTLKIVSNILMSRGSVGDKYIDSLTQQMNLYSTEFNLINNVALVHAPIADNIFKSDLIILYSQEGFKFTTAYVHLIVAFSVVDDVDLILPLQDLYALLNTDAFIKYLESRPKAEEFHTFLLDSLKK